MLDIGHNEIKKIPKEIGLLRVLELSDNELSSIPNSIASCKKLRRLNLRNNNICSLPEEIGDLENLLELDLRGNISFSSRSNASEPQFVSRRSNASSYASLFLGYSLLSVTFSLYYK